MASQGKRMVPEALIKKLQDFSNNGLAALTAGNITTLTTNQINSLKCGDIVCKEDLTGKHAYIVSYKGEGGICITYTDASVVETVSYDLIDGEWVYNSTDIININTVVANPTLAGTEATLTGLQVGDTKYAMPHLYVYTFTLQDINTDDVYFSIFSSEKFNSVIELFEWWKNNIESYAFSGFITNSSYSSCALSNLGEGETTYEYYSMFDNETITETEKPDEESQFIKITKLF